MSDEDQGKRVRRVRLDGAAIAHGTSKEEKRRAFSHLDKMSYMEKPQDYEDGKGGRCEGLWGRLTSWFKFKPGPDERKEPNGDYRIVFKPEEDEDETKFITVSSIGGRDNVYDKQYQRKARR